MDKYTPNTRTLSTAESNWSAVETALLDHHFRPDLQAARAVYAGIAAHRLSGTPVWIMNVAPPGSMKTELIQALKGQKRFQLIDDLTPNTFLSGQILDPKKKATTRSPSLLHRIGSDGILGYADFSTVLAMNPDKRNPILAAMRRIYDGEFSREYGTAERLKDRTWTGRITFTTAATPAIDDYYSIFQSLGERFLLVRSARPDGVDSARSAMRQNITQAKQDLRAAVDQLFSGLPDYEPGINTQDFDGIAHLAEFTVRARTHVPRNSYGKKEIRYVPEAEAPTRLAQQLCQVAKGSALLGNRDTVAREDLMLVKRVALDCIPAVRRKILVAVIDGSIAADGEFQFSSIDLPKVTRFYAAEDLEALDLLENCKGWNLSDLSIQLIGGSRMFA
jgi:hypothetical protein